uniref:NADH-ubiquinone oxidoreductase chain 2 n=1 Tax=Adelium sp. NCS-2009 TaxID=590155 RepID=D1G5P8_9CUCU|nr:NADH dehydrogenase subunit 2 [Adelium sp. NCS-2009]ACM45063.1 NADH dehydrogenase subunit 2 [Adelium sp. NCS-2009]
MKLYKIVFTSTLILGTMMAISSYSWLTMWMGMEINLLSIIPLLSSQKNLYSSESSMKYFITQAIASTILLMSVVMMLLMNEFISPQMNSWFSTIMNSALLTKMGAAPFHFWFPEVMEGLNWVNCLIMLTWQKIAPMAVMMSNHLNKNFMMAVIIMCLSISTIMAINQVSLRKLMAFSSINHIAWMIAAMMISSSSWMVYFCIYSLMNLTIVLTFKATHSFYLKQLSSAMNKNKLIKISFMTNFLSLGGLPPFIGFMPKWFVINWMINNNMYSASFLMIVLTLIMLFVYIRMTFSSILLEINEPKTPNIKINHKSISTINVTSILGLLAIPFVFNLL